MHFLNKGIASKATSQPQLLMEDQKDKKENGNYPTRLAIPAMTFMAKFSKISYIGIKRVLDDNQVNYATLMIIQASDLKKKLETMKLKSEE
eukprot:9911671-Ditylum_brightwellii.AAC.1